jgi:hypothetical protein
LETSPGLETAVRSWLAAARYRALLAATSSYERGA